MDTRLEAINQAIEDLKTDGISVKDVSDGYHTFDELYEFRKQYNAAFANILYFNLLRTAHHVPANPNGKTELTIYKSKKHSDGKPCFDGTYFIVMFVYNEKQISNHYQMKDWDLFKIPEVNVPLHKYDGHTPKDTLISLEQFNKDF